MKKLNELPNSLHPTRTPKVIMEGTKVDLNTDQVLPFGQICMFHAAGKSQNKREARSELGIALGPSDITYGAVRCYLFKEKVVVDRSHYTVLNRVPTDFPFPIKDHRKASSECLADFLFLKESSRGLITEVASRHEDGELLVADDDTPVAHNPLSAASNTEPQLGSPLNTNLPDPELSIFDPAISQYMRQEDSEEQSQEDNRVESDITQSSLDTFSPSMETLPDSYPIDDSADAPITAEEIPSLAERGNTPPEPQAETSIETQPQSRYPQRTRSTNWKTIKRNQDNTEKVFRISVKQALTGEYAQQSKEAVMDEIRNMLSYQVGHYVRYDQIPKRYRQNLLSSFMFVKHKKKPDGRYDKTKARLVGNGKQQRKHLYNVIASSTVSLTSVFLLLNYASYLKAKKVSYDIKGAFLHAKFTEADEPIYLVIGREVASLWITLDPAAANFLTEKGELILCLDRFIYGLKQSPYKFQLELQATLIGLGYEACANDECLFVKKVGPDISLLSTHVDDILQVSTNDTLIEELRTHLSTIFAQVTFNDKADAYLGMSITTSDDLHTIRLSQKGLTEDIIRKFLKDETSSVKTPADSDLFEVDKLADKPDADDNNFISIVMSLMYLARLTRPDILLPVTYLASRAHCPNKDDYKKLGRIIRYLKGTVNEGTYIQCKDIRLYCHCDASYGIHSDGRSHTGFILSLGGSHSYLHARSLKQKVTALSSTDAEIIAVSDAMKQIVWITNLMREIDIASAKPSIMYQDNRSSIWMITEPTRYRRSKHILIKIAYIKEKYTEGLVEYEYLMTGKMTSDMLTKPLQGLAFQKHKRSLMQSFSESE